MPFSRRPSGGRSHGDRRAQPDIPEDPAEARNAAYLAGLRLLAARELSASALADRLRGRGYPDEAVNDALARLIASGSQSDTRAARSLAHTLVSIKRRGRLRAQRELESRGFARDVAAAALAEFTSAGDERLRLDKVLEGKLRGAAIDPADRATIRRLYATLLRRGYTSSAIRDALRRRTGGDPPVDDETGDE